MEFEQIAQQENIVHLLISIQFQIVLQEHFQQEIKQFVQFEELENIDKLDNHNNLEQQDFILNPDHFYADLEMEVIVQVQLINLLIIDKQDNML